MKTLKDFRFCISLRPLFSESGKLALEFELKQFFIVLAEVIPCLLYLQALNRWEPLTMLFAISSTFGLAGSGNATAVGNTTNVTSMFDDDVNTYPNITLLYAEESELISRMDPVGYTSVIIPSMVAWAMACSFTGRLSSRFYSRRAILELLAVYIVILSVCYFSIRFFSELMGSNTSFFVVDIPHIALFYVLWQTFCFRTNKTYQPKVRYERINQVGGNDLGGESLDDAARKANFILAILLPMVLTIFYMFVLIPSFQSCPPHVQTMLRIFGHTFIKSQSDVRQRDAIATGTFLLTVKLECNAMFPMECIWATAGRFLISAGNNDGWLLVTLVGVFVMEWSMRVNAECLEGAWLQLLG